jgi:hypothetical protein
MSFHLQSLWTEINDPFQNFYVLVYQILAINRACNIDAVLYKSIHWQVVITPENLMEDKFKHFTIPTSSPSCLGKDLKRIQKSFTLFSGGSKRTYWGGGVTKTMIKNVKIKVISCYLWVNILLLWEEKCCFSSYTL